MQSNTSRDETDRVIQSSAYGLRIYTAFIGQDYQRIQIRNTQTRTKTRRISGEMTEVCLETYERRIVRWSVFVSGEDAAEPCRDCLFAE